MVVPFAQRLSELGWIEGRTVTIEYRWAEGLNERATEVAAEFVRLKVDVIVAVGTPQTAAAKQATSVTPIVFVLVGDPVGTGLVASLPQPGGNVTGLSNASTDTATKRLQLLHDIVLNFRRLAIMANIDNPVVVQEMGEVRGAAAALGLAAATSVIRRAEDIAPLIEAIRGRADALYVCADGLTISNRVRINTLALDARLPTIHRNRVLLEGGGLISYGANNADLFRRAAEIVHKVLRGTKPADIPVEQPSKFELVINIKAAKALGLTSPIPCNCSPTR
jgi:putative ABC transport system substrate-binding protein